VSLIAQSSCSARTLREEAVVAERKRQTRQERRRGAEDRESGGDRRLERRITQTLKPSVPRQQRNAHTHARTPNRVQRWYALVKSARREGEEEGETEGEVEEAGRGPD